jgi:hypothetical protein
VRYTRREQEALDAVGELGPATLGQLTRHLQCDRSNLYRLLQRLCGRNLVQGYPAEQGYVYTLSPLSPLSLSSVDDNARGEPPATTMTRATTPTTGTTMTTETGDEEDRPR